jgi:TolB-like protein/AraC-like DNA-binding protein
VAVLVQEIHAVHTLKNTHKLQYRESKHFVYLSCLLSLKIRGMTFETGDGNEFLEILTRITLENLENENFGVMELSLHAGMSISTLNRRLHKITSKAACQFIREIRLQKAMELLMQQTYTASEVAYRVGFGSPAYFGKCFHDFYGFPPGEVRKRMEEGILPVPGEPNTSCETNTLENLLRGEYKVSVKLQKFKKPYLGYVLGGLIALIFGFAIFYLTEKGEFNYQLVNRERSIAVLPFKNLSNEDDSQYFADGIMDEILNHLFRIGDLRVISRTTAERFRDSKMSTTEIAQSVGVNYLLEGSVRKQGEQVRIIVQLIDGKRDRHLWSEIYDRQLTDIFHIQSEIATNIARELRAVITPLEKTLIKKVPTRNLEAYNYYLIGNNYYWRGFDAQDYTIAISMYSKAIELDSEFALAYIRLSICHGAMFWFHFDRNYDRFLQSREALEIAISLDPELPEIHIASGYFNLWWLLDYKKALEEFSLAEAMLRNHPECIFMTAAVYRRAGDWKLATENFLLASELDPGSTQIAHNTAENFFLLGEFRQSEGFFNRASLLSPTFMYSYYIKCLNVPQMERQYLSGEGNNS